MNRKGLTLVEMILSIAVLAVLMAAGMRMINPSGMLAGGRNSQRELHIQAIMNGVRQKIADTSGGAWNCVSGALPTTTKVMAIGTGNYDIAPCLVPDYLTNLPYDPIGTSTRYQGNADYNTGYAIMRNASTGQVTISAPMAEKGQIISIIR